MNTVEISSFEADAKFATDFLIMKQNALTFACRIRTEPYFYKYPDEFTIRLDRPSGAETEMDKIMKGFADRMLYAFGTNDGNILAYKIGDLNAFRKSFKYRWDRDKKLPSQIALEKRNNDGTKFLVFKWSSRILQINKFVVDDGYSIKFLSPGPAFHPSQSINTRTTPCPTLLQGQTT